MNALIILCAVASLLCFCLLAGIVRRQAKHHNAPYLVRVLERLRADIADEEPSYPPRRAAVVAPAPGALTPGRESQLSRR